MTPTATLANEQERFGKDFQHATFLGMHPKSLREFKGACRYSAIEECARAYAML
jgi:hypothetical protein